MTFSFVGVGRSCPAPINSAPPPPFLSFRDLQEAGFDSLDARLGFHLYRATTFDGLTGPTLF
jgi:hypothetical protein